MSQLFDMELRARRRDRAARTGPELFLFERAFADCVERLALVQRRFERGLLLGCPDRTWPIRLREFADEWEVFDPGSLFAAAASGIPVVEDDWNPHPQLYDLVLAIGTLDTVNDLPRALEAIFTAMRPQSLFLGAFSGGDTLPQLRSAMRAADVATGVASAHVHPRIKASAVAPLLQQGGFVEPVVDVDRATVSYSSLHRLVDDVRRMGATNILSQRSREPLSRRAVSTAAQSFADAGQDGRTVETFEIVHFACWTPSSH